jgi:hypothetical protein
MCNLYPVCPNEVDIQYQIENQIRTLVAHIKDTERGRGYLEALVDLYETFKECEDYDAGLASHAKQFCDLP